jgi:cobalt-zinc-cadmium efflux system outer membrane protein
VLSLADALNWALQHNPEIATLRQQHGIAAAGVVIARTYPFNPIGQSFVWGAGGPETAGITNRVFNEHTFRLDLELRGQGRHRRAMAQAALSRTDWEIANQELVLAVRVVRAFNTLLYRRAKLRLADELVRLQEETLSQVTRLAEQNRVGRADVLLARADAAEARVLRGPTRTVADIALQDLRRALGVTDEPIEVAGTLETTPVLPEAGELTRVALDRRPDLKALRLAVQEADARLRLEVANRYGNPSLGPGMEYNETRVTFVGMWLVWQIPVLNTRQGEILQRQAERRRAQFAVQQGEVLVQQDVRAALTRLADAEAVVNAYGTETLPGLRDARDTLDRLFTQGEPGVDLARVLEVRRRLLRARDAYLDALWEMSQARADLAAALGDPSVALADCEGDKPAR